MATSKASWRRLLLLVALFVYTTHAWEWSELVVGGEFSTEKTLSLHEVSELRVRDLRRKLTRNHGYRAEEVAAILDKKELIEALAFEEEKVRLQVEEKVKRALVQRGILFAIVAVLVVMCWPLLRHASEVLSINFVVFTDRKRLEVSRCFELKSFWGMVGVLLMFVVDLLQVWLSVSVVLSWVMRRNKWFFPMPAILVHPAKFMGGQMAQSSLANYGVNVGPMAITWLLRFVNGRLEAWTGKALARARKVQRKKEREWETPEQRASRRSARKEAKLAKERQRYEQQRGREPPPPEAWMPKEEKPIPTGTSAHSEFLNQVDECPIDPSEFPDETDEPVTSAMDDLD